MKNDNVIVTLPKFYFNWKVSMEIFPIGTVLDWGSILHLTTGGDDQVYGDRTPGLFFNEGETSLYIDSAVNGHPKYTTDVTHTTAEFNIQ